jgi:lysophospholipase L1-like esterase
MEQVPIQPRLETINEMLQRETQALPRRVFIDVATSMPDEIGQPCPKLFVEDVLHLSRAGFQQWAR